MRSQCPGCGTLYKIALEHLGRQVQCKKCGRSFVIEAVSSATTPPATRPQNDPQPSPCGSQATRPEQETSAPEIKMAMQSQCPCCDALYQITQEHLGQNLQCQNCGNNFVIEAVANSGPKLISQPQSASQPQPQTQPSVDQTSQMVQVACQNCGTVNQMPPGVACNCGRCGQLLPVSAPADKLCSTQVSPQDAAQPQPTTQAQSAVTPKLAIGQVLGSVFSILLKKPAIFFGLGLVAGLPSALFLSKHAKTIETAEEIAEFTGEDEIVITDYLYNLADIVDYMSCMLLGAAFAYIVFKVLRQEAVSVRQAYDFSKTRMWSLFGATLLVGLATGLGLMLFIIPGVIVAVLLSMTIPVCSIEGLGAVNSLKRGLELTKGYRLPIFGLYLISGVLIGGVQLLFDESLDIVDSFIWYNIFYTLLNAFPLAFGLVMTVVIYFKLRKIKENVILDHLVDVFELNQSQVKVADGDQNITGGNAVMEKIKSQANLLWAGLKSWKSTKRSTAQPITAPQATTRFGTAQAMPQPQIAAHPELGVSSPLNGFIIEEEQTNFARFIHRLTFKKKVLGIIAGLLIVVAIFVWSHPEIIGGSTDKVEVLASRLGGTWTINENNFQGKMVFTPDKKDSFFGNYCFFDSAGNQLANESYQVLHTSEKDYLELALAEGAEESFQITFKSRNEVVLVINDVISVDLTRGD